MVGWPGGRVAGWLVYYSVQNSVQNSVQTSARTSTRTVPGPVPEQCPDQYQTSARTVPEPSVYALVHPGVVRAFGVDPAPATPGTPTAPRWSTGTSPLMPGTAYTLLEVPWGSLPAAPVATFPADVTWSLSPAPATR